MECVEDEKNRARQNPFVGQHQPVARNRHQDLSGHDGGDEAVRAGEPDRKKSDQREYEAEAEKQYGFEMRQRIACHVIVAQS